MKNRISIIIPSYNPSDRLITVVDGLVDAGFDDIIIVNDGSRADCTPIFDKVRATPQCTVLTHENNRGKGAGLKTAFAYFLENRKDYDGVLCADDDGQHTVEDIVKIAEAFDRDNPKLLLGVRDFSKDNVPPKSRFGNRITSTVFRIFFGLHITDTQTGLRLLSSSDVEKLIDTDGDRYEFETNMLLRLSSLHIDYEEITIETIYINDNSETHFRPIADSIRIYGLILKYLASSLASFGVDYVLFFVLSLLLEPTEWVYRTAICYVGARLVSSFVNYMLNSRIFGNERTGKTVLRYYTLAAGIAAVSAAALNIITLLIGDTTPIIETLLKIPVDMILMIVSFRVQKKWVFQKENNG